MLKVSILTIGDEILLGDVVNTNAAWLGDAISSTGAKLIAHSVCGDSREIMLSELSRLSMISDFIVITGGLGPTHDDITKRVLVEYFDDEFIFVDDVFQNLKNYIERRGRKVLEKHKEQAMLPSKCRYFINEVGTAPAMLFEHNSTAYISLPGVPSEMKFLMTHHILPIIENKVRLEKDIHKFKLIKTAGIPESALSDLIGNPDDFLEGGTLAFLPSYHGVRLRIGVDAANVIEADAKLEKLSKYIESRASQYIFGFGSETLHSKIANLLTEKKQTLSLAESCTGGLIASLLTSLAGSSSYLEGAAVTYSNESKINILGVNRDTIEKYGAVSEETAYEMAQLCREKFGSDYAISVTGIAGPSGGTEEKPVGTVFIGLADRNSTTVQKYIFGQNREQNRDLSVGSALILLLDKLREQK